MKTGLTADLQLFKQLYFAPEVSVLSKGGKIKQRFERDQYFLQLTGFARFTYIEVPINIGYMFNVPNGKFLVAAGPSFSLGLGGKIKTELDKTNLSLSPAEVDSLNHIYKVRFDGKDMSEVTDNDVHYRAFEIGANMVMAYYFRDRFSVRSGINIGLNDIDPNAGYSTENWYVSIGVAYHFNIH